MRLRDDNQKGRSLLRGLAACMAFALLTACHSISATPPASTVAGGARANGPQADFPILVGPAYEVNGVIYTPLDTLNYDEVGQATLDEGAMGVTGSHHTLPIPSYVEVTSLETGRTILVRLERRGPMMANDLIALSPAALAQLDARNGLEVRVRRVNPPEDHRAMLRAGEVAPARMDTPMALVAILRRKLPAKEPHIAPVVSSAALPVATPPPSTAAASEVVSDPMPALVSGAVEQPAASPVSSPAMMADALFVQAAAFSTQERADRAAAALDGKVSPGGRFFLVRTGPFATREEAAASLAKVRAAGYADARILTGG